MPEIEIPFFSLFVAKKETSAELVPAAAAHPAAVPRPRLEGGDAVAKAMDFPDSKTSLPWAGADSGWILVPSSRNPWCLGTGLSEVLG